MKIIKDKDKNGKVEELEVEERNEEKQSLIMMDIQKNIVAFRYYFCHLKLTDDSLDSELGALYLLSYSFSAQGRILM